jgi:hypothetical protein
MTPSTSSTKSCTKAEARSRLRQAKEYLDLADLYGPNDPEDRRTVGASNAVLAGIAAADAACCWVLRERSTGQHEEAPALLRKVAGAKSAANALMRLIDVKTQVQYIGRANAADLTGAQRQARTVVGFADKLIS